jgi:hypothetical protein
LEQLFEGVDGVRRTADCQWSQRLGDSKETDAEDRNWKGNRDVEEWAEGDLLLLQELLR